MSPHNPEAGHEQSPPWPEITQQQFEDLETVYDWQLDRGLRISGSRPQPSEADPSLVTLDPMPGTPYVTFYYQRIGRDEAAATGIFFRAEPTQGRPQFFLRATDEHGLEPRAIDEELYQEVLEFIPQAKDFMESHAPARRRRRLRWLFGD